MAMVGAGDCPKCGCVTEWLNLPVELGGTVLDPDERCIDPECGWDSREEREIMCPDWDEKELPSWMGGAK